MWLEYLGIAAAVLRAHKVRSLLTVLSITIGAFSIVLMTSLADSGLKTLLVGVEELGGSQLLSVWRKPPDAKEARQLSYTRGLTRADAAAVEDIPHLRSVTQLAVLGGKSAQTDAGRQRPVDLVASDPRFFSFFRYRAAQGRLFDARDAALHARVCVIGDTLADKLFDRGTDVVGRSLQVAKLRCRIVGRLEKVDRWGIRFGWDWDNVLVLPLEALSDVSLGELDAARQLFLQTEGPAYNDVVKRVMNARLLVRHHDVDDFAIFDLEKRLAGFVKVFLIMKVIVGLLAAITLLVGGVGIMNIMLVSVAERVREIGIRKALGATPTDIGRQFLVEAALLSGAGGLLGAACGVASALGASALIRHFKPSWVTSVSQPAVLASLLVATVIGLLFGYFPARRAGRLDPVQAMRG